MVSNGSTHYDHDRDGTHSQVAGCHVSIIISSYVCTCTLSIIYVQCPVHVLCMYTAHVTSCTVYTSVCESCTMSTVILFSSCTMYTACVQCNNVHSYLVQFMYNVHSMCPMHVTMYTVILFSSCTMYTACVQCM